MRHSPVAKQRVTRRWTWSETPPMHFRDHSILLSDTAHVRPKAFSNIRIQDPNTFLCAENAMNVQAGESVCHGKKLYRRPENIQHKFFQFSYSKFRHCNHRIGAHT